MRRQQCTIVHINVSFIVTPKSTEPSPLATEHSARFIVSRDHKRLYGLARAVDGCSLRPRVDKSRKSFGFVLRPELPRPQRIRHRARRASHPRVRSPDIFVHKQFAFEEVKSAPGTLAVDSEVFATHIGAGDGAVVPEGPAPDCPLFGQCYSGDLLAPPAVDALYFSIAGTAIQATLCFVCSIVTVPS